MTLDKEIVFHRTWLGLAQPSEGLTFSLPVLADAQIAPNVRTDVTAAFASYLDEGRTRIVDAERFFREFLGYAAPGALVAAGELPEELSFYAAEGGQEIRPTFALARGPLTAATASDDPFAIFDAPPAPSPAATKPDAGGARASASPFARAYAALVWDLTAGLAPGQEPPDLDQPEEVTGPWRYPPTAKLERLLRQAGVPVGLLFNGRALRLVYAPAGETTGHLTFRVEHLAPSEGRPLLAAMELLLHARRLYAAGDKFTLEGLLADSRSRQADVTETLARQVFDAVETLLGGFEAAAKRDTSPEALATSGTSHDWLRAALEAPDDHLYQGILSFVLRLVFLLYAEDQGLMPVEHPVYAEHLSVGGLYQRLAEDKGAHPESMHHRFGAYGRLLSLFRASFFGVRHGTLVLPPRHGRLFDPNTFPFLEGGLPEWTSAGGDVEARARVRPPSVDDGTLHEVLEKLLILGRQRLSYRTLDVEQLGSVYESLMGYHVLRLESAGVRLGAQRVWVEARALMKMSATDRGKLLKETCGLNPGPIKAIEALIKEAGKDEEALAEGLRGVVKGRGDEAKRNHASALRLVLQPGEERRRTGSHYTPRSLTEQIVKTTLAPLLRCLGEAPTAAQILELKICDPAMGSGAFLVATCRELAGEIVAAWTRAGELSAVLEKHGDAHLHARRLVAQQCLYGVDKNAAAVELAKLSLWLVTMDRALPFTFVDHVLRHGDSLVGLDLKQIAAFHWAPDGQQMLMGRVQEALDEALGERLVLHEQAEEEGPGAQEEKRRQLAFSQQAIDDVRAIANACVGAFFAGKTGKERERERVRRYELVRRWLDEGSEDARSEIRGLGEEAQRGLSPFHWWLEFPEVFYLERRDPLVREGGGRSGPAMLEGVVGNPPFAGKNTIADSNADGYPDWLKVVSPGAHGNADLSAHFFRRAAALLGEHGALGLVATNTIGQGDTRSSGLQPLIAEGWRLFDVTPTMSWPGAAAVVVSVVHAVHGRPQRDCGAQIAQKAVHAINSRLRPTPERPDPVSLLSNHSLSYQGSIPLGAGFVLDRSERDALTARSASNSACIFPYIGGEEVNTSPLHSPTRYVINFGAMTLESAERWPDLIARLREKVKPERDRNSRDARRVNWWKFAEAAPALYSAISGADRCLVVAHVTKHLSFSFQPTGRVFSQNLYVFPLSAFSSFAVLQSRTHSGWAWLLSSTMKTDLSYGPSDCFETFPFPQPDPRTVIPALEDIGQRFYEARAAFMVETDQGLTKTYNAMKDPACDIPAVLALRALSEELDRAVLDAYGWTDVAVPPFCPLTEEDKAAVEAFEDEVIDRLYVLNAERAREEARAGAAAAAGGKKKGAAKKPRGSGSGQGEMFE